MSGNAAEARAALDAVLTKSLDETFAAAARRAGEWLACRAGCTECCIGPFPITRLDAGRLRTGLLQLEAVDPAEAAAIRLRAAEQCRLLSQGFPGDASSGQFDDDASASDAFLARHARLACPALVPATGLCALYEHRPVSCRTFGPPVRLGGQDLPPCNLCFIDAPVSEVERCRVEPDPDGLEEALLDTWPDCGEWETLIAFALRGEPAATPPTGRTGG